jgi:hypothetical protein
MRDWLQKIPGYWWGVLVGCLLILSVSFSIRDVKRELGLWSRSTQMLAELQEMEAGLKEDKRRLADEYAGGAVSLMALAGDSLRDQVEIQPVEQRSLPEGYELRRVRIDFKSLRWDQVREFISRLESSSPPWRVEELQITAGFSDLNGFLKVRTLNRQNAIPE